MSYLTLEVEIDHGKVPAKEPSKLPERASGLLTIIQPGGTKPATMSQLEAFGALQSCLQLTEEAATEWMATVHDARR